MCKIQEWNDIIKDILKKKNDVHWISDGTEEIKVSENLTIAPLQLFSCSKKTKF